MRTHGPILAALWLLLCVPPALADGGPVVEGIAGHYAARAYLVRWDADTLTVLTPAGEELLRWPVGAACSPAEPHVPLAAQPERPPRSPEVAPADRGTRLTWRWRYPAPCPFLEQIETYRLLPDRIEIQVGLRWRERPTRLVRLVYGGSLVPGCWDLEGLWEAEADGRWLPSPVPCITHRTGVLPYRRPIALDAKPGPLRLVLGGVDDGDVATWDGWEIGRTPSDRAAASWEAVRRYGVAPAAAGTHELRVEVGNDHGAGGIWRGPCVLGPPEALAASPEGDGWQRVRLVGAALHHWCPDAYRVPLAGRFTVSLTSLDRTREAVPENVTSGGRFLLPPYLVAVEGAHGWWGLGTLDLPSAEDGLRVEYRDGALACPFLLATVPGLAAGGMSLGPRLAILPAASRADAMARYLQALPPREPAPREEWWSGPEYCTWGDQEYARQDPADLDGAALTEERLARWLGALEAGGLETPLVALDAGWWQLPPATIDALHAEGRHVVLWTQPHWGPDTTRHAEWAMHDATGAPLTYDPSNWILDYSLPEVRAHMEESLRSYVSPEGWDADGIKLDFPYTPAPVWALHADPAWAGAGERYRAEVLRFVYRTLKQAKPDALVTCVSANPLLGRVQDVCRLNDDWTADPETYRRRAAVALAVGEWANCDDWHAYEEALEAQAVERPVWGTFTLMSALWRGDRDNARRPLSVEWTGRLHSILHLARLAPVRAGDRCAYDPEAGVCRRETASGALVAEALPLVGESGPARVLVVAAGAGSAPEGAATLLVAATGTGRVEIPLRTGVESVTEVLDDGSRRALPFERTAEGVLLTVEDAAGPVAWYEVEVSAGQTDRPGGA